MLRRIVSFLVSLYWHSFYFCPMFRACDEIMFKLWQTNLNRIRCTPFSFEFYECRFESYDGFGFERRHHIMWVMIHDIVLKITEWKFELMMTVSDMECILNVFYLQMFSFQPAYQVDNNDGNTQCSVGKIVGLTSFFFDTAESFLKSFFEFELCFGHFIYRFQIKFFFILDFWTGRQFEYCSFLII